MALGALSGGVLAIILVAATLCGCAKRSNTDADNAAQSSVFSDNTASAPAAAPRIGAADNPDSSNSTGPTSATDQELASIQATSLLNQENAQCVDQIVTAAPSSKSRQQLIDEATTGCMSIAVRKAKLTPGADPREIERAFVAEQVDDLLDSAPPTNAMP